MKLRMNLIQNTYILPSDITGNINTLHSSSERSPLCSEVVCVVVKLLLLTADPLHQHVSALLPHLGEQGVHHGPVPRDGGPDRLPEQVTSSNRRCREEKSVIVKSNRSCYSGAARADEGGEISPLSPIQGAHFRFELSSTETFYC